MKKHGKKMFKLPKSEEERIHNILKRAFDKESGKLSDKDVSITEDNPDGCKHYSNIYFTRINVKKVISTNLDLTRYNIVFSL